MLGMADERGRVMSKVKIELVDMEQLPLCPYCEKELSSIAFKDKAWGARSVYACPHCRKILGMQ